VQICLTALNAYPAVDPLAGGPIGGIETRAWSLARGLAALPDLRVQLVVRTPSPPRQDRVDGVELVALVDPLYPVWQAVGTALERRPGFPWVRVRRWDPRLLWQLPRVELDRLLRGRAYDADRSDPRLVGLQADVYGTFGVQTHSAVVIRSAREAGRPSVLFLGSDGDLDPLFETGGGQRDPYGTRADVGRSILSSADLVIAQTPAQQARLSDRFGRASELLLNPIDVAAWDAGREVELPEALTAGLSRFVLWVGRAEDLHKRPQLCLDAARLCPEVPFLMILNPRDPAVADRIRREAPPNLRIIEQAPFPQMPAIFARAAALLSTSRLEGFPNVFLQAALSGVPIVSLEVGAEFLAEARAGTCHAGDLPAAAEQLRRCWAGTPGSGCDRSTAHESSAAREYVIQRHDQTQQVQRLADRLRSLTQHPGR